jgi:hypothetical protein
LFNDATETRHRHVSPVPGEIGVGLDALETLDAFEIAQARRFNEYRERLA